VELFTVECMMVDC